MSDNIVSLPTPMNALADRIRKAHERTEHGRQEWIEGTLELGAALAEARGRFSADRQFSEWLAGNELDHLGRNDRSALISMAANPETFRAVLLDQDDVLHANTLWQKYRARFQNDLKPTHDRQPESATAENPIKTSDKVESAPAADDGKRSATAPDRSKLSKVQRGGDIYAIYTGNQSRAILGKLLIGNSGQARDLRQIVLQSIDAGFAKVNSLKIEVPTLRMLFTDLTPGLKFSTIKLTDKNERARVRDYIMPAALAHRDEYFAAPDQLEAIVAAHWDRKRRAAVESAAQKKVAEAMAAMPANETEVVMFDRRFWPRIDSLEYDYRELAAAVFSFNELHNLAKANPNNSPRSRGMLIRHATKWLLQYASQSGHGDYRRILQIVAELSRAMERSPDGTCLFPRKPSLESMEID